MMSDVLPGEITRLDIDKSTGNAIVRNGSSKEYFGANIHAILADSFFLEYTIGEYSRTFLQESYERLIRYYEQGELDDEAREYIQEMRLFLPHIGDSLIYRAFEMILNQLDR